MDFIVAASNLRAANYEIPPADRHKVHTDGDDDKRVVLIMFHRK